MSMGQTDIKPVRLQRSRRIGSKLTSPNGLPVVCVTRPGKHGNPFKVGARIEIDQRGHICPGSNHFGTVLHSAHAVLLYRDYALFMLACDPGWFDDIRGKNLACWCGSCDPDKPWQPRTCHADVALELANRPKPNFTR